jgi:hypothetical protein
MLERLRSYFKYLILLLFSKTILLTPAPINLGVGFTRLELAKPIQAITPGASLQLDITSMLKPLVNNNFLEIKKKTNELFPIGSVSATLTTDSGVDVLLSNNGGFLYRKDRVTLSLHNKKGVPVYEDFQFLQFRSDIKFENVKIYWKNFNL